MALGYEFDNALVFKKIVLHPHGNMYTVPFWQISKTGITVFKKTIWNWDKDLCSMPSLFYIGNSSEVSELGIVKNKQTKTKTSM